MRCSYMDIVTCPIKYKAGNTTLRIHASCLCSLAMYFTVYTQCTVSVLENKMRSIGTFSDLVTRLLYSVNTILIFVIQCYTYAEKVYVLSL